ncbi:Uncharacterised protein [Clostridium paraputrificum]|nr:Uncharacterised protein [Clostridium paraputrificum]
MWAASSGAMTASMARRSSVASVPATLKKYAATRSSRRPDASSASRVLANDGSSGLATIAAISASWSTNAVRKAGMTCSLRLALASAAAMASGESGAGPVPRLAAMISSIRRRPSNASRA